MEQSPRSPRAQTRYALDQFRVNPNSDIEVPQVKAEVYAIAGYFIEKAVARALDWVQAHPNQGLRQQVEKVAGSQVQSSVILVEDLRGYLAHLELDTTLRKISTLIEGLLHYHVKEVMNSDSPAPLVNPGDEPVQERLRSLLEGNFRGGGIFRARDFVINTTRAPAIFIPPALHSAISGFYNEFKRVPSHDELAIITKKLSPLVLKLAQFNIDDIGAFNEAYFGTLGPDRQLDVRAFDSSLLLKRNGDDYSFVFSEVQNYKSPTSPVEPTIGCPALYSQVGTQNVIRHMVDYAVDLLKQSGVFQK